MTGNIWACVCFLCILEFVKCCSPISQEQYWKIDSKYFYFSQGVDGEDGTPGIPGVPVCYLSLYCKLCVFEPGRTQVLPPLNQLTIAPNNQTPHKAQILIIQWFGFLSLRAAGKNYFLLGMGSSCLKFQPEFWTLLPIFLEGSI